VKPLFEARVGTACCGNPDLRYDVFQLPSNYEVRACGTPALEKEGPPRSTLEK
jgi:hypothetical protein